MTKPKSYAIKIEVTENLDRPTLSSIWVRRILKGEFDDDLENILEAAHHRKRELREGRRR